MLRSAWRHVAYNLRQGGLRQVAGKAAWRARQWAWSESPWLVYHLDTSSPGREPALPLTERLLGFEDLLNLGYYKAMSFPEAVRRRLESGAVCRGFFTGSELANVAWTSRGYLEIEPGLILRDPSCAAVFDCYTLPEHRLKGIYTDTLIRMIRAARDDGARRVLIAVDPQNRASIRAIERAGFKPYRRILNRCRFGFRSRAESEFSSMGRALANSVSG